MIGVLKRWWEGFPRRFTIGIDVGPNEYIKSTGRDSVKYTKGDRSIEVQVELWGGRIDYAIYTSTIKRWLPPHENEPVSEADRQAIVAAIIRYLEKSGRTYEVK